MQMAAIERTPIPRVGQYRALALGTGQTPKPAALHSQPLHVKLLKDANAGRKSPQPQLELCQAVGGVWSPHSTLEFDVSPIFPGASRFRERPVFGQLRLLSTPQFVQQQLFHHQWKL